MMPLKTPSTDNWWLRGVIARSVGIIAIALGFVIGMYGLDHPDFTLAADRTGVTRDRDGGPRLCALLLDQTDAATEFMISLPSGGVINLDIASISAH